jgi:hypothetical protein
MIQFLSDQHLIESYLQAIRFELEEDFINLLFNEIQKRKLKISSYDNDSINHSYPQ